MPSRLPRCTGLVFLKVAHRSASFVVMKDSPSSCYGHHFRQNKAVRELKRVTFHFRNCETTL